jgi:hypothetical protein
VAGKTSTAEKIISSLKGLQAHLQPDEEPLFTIPGIWDAGGSRHSVACDIVVTNQRVFGYYLVTFPRERLFLDALALDTITHVALRQKSFEPVFRELLISDGTRKIYIRAPRQKIEALYSILGSTIKSSAPDTDTDFSEAQSKSNASATPSHSTLVYGRQEIRRPFEKSPLALMLLFVGGIILEIIGVGLWMLTQNAPTGVPLCAAGFLAVFMAIVVSRQKR